MTNFQATPVTHSRSLCQPQVLGIDFTSAPSRKKPITVARCNLNGNVLHVLELQKIERFPDFEKLLASGGPWIGGFDFPFGLPREAINALHWPEHWSELVLHCASLGRAEFTAASDRLRMSRPAGKRYPKRRGDECANSHSPMKCVRPPVGWMFLEGAPRLLRSGVHIPGIHSGDPLRVAIEAYPGMLARALIGRTSYKHDARAKQTPERRAARELIWSSLADNKNPLHIKVLASPAYREEIIADGSGDLLDSTICAMQAAWALHRQHTSYGLPSEMDPIEGWIASSEIGK